ncbi:hypothetical protein [Undibacterium sp.]|uniref:hypothetical protein n=1 Tax=Undibacterium sp. TaxID=1914977 RepID=UPI00374DB568
MSRAIALDGVGLAGHGALSREGTSNALPDTSRIMSVALWVFMLVASALFMLFLAAYMMRMLSPDWSPVGMPWQLWLSSACLLSGSAALHFAGATARAGALERSRLLFVIGGACALAFLLVQGWAWHLLLDMQVRPAGNPAGSFFTC